jgi:chromate reductase, NAD(P)H dehydrogenase (quinone)
MTAAPRILALAGSTREASYNKRLVRVAAAGARAAGAEVTVIDLRDFPLPLYDGDLEASAGLPAHAIRLKDLFKAHGGLLIGTPEYNGGMSGVLKNLIDWVSRRGDDERSLAAFTGKVGGLIAASPGAFGGMRSLAQLRQVLSGIGVLVIPEQRAVGRAGEAFDDAGGLKDPDQQAAVEAIGARVADLLRRLAC